MQVLSGEVLKTCKLKKINNCLPEVILFIMTSPKQTNNIL